MHFGYISCDCSHCSCRAENSGGDVLFSACSQLGLLSLQSIACFCGEVFRAVAFAAAKHIMSPAICQTFTAFSLFSISYKKRYHFVCLQGGFGIQTWSNKLKEVWSMYHLTQNKEKPRWEARNFAHLSFFVHFVEMSETDKTNSGLHPIRFEMGLFECHHELCESHNVTPVHILHSISLQSQHIKPSDLSHWSILSSQDICFCFSLADIISFKHSTLGDIYRNGLSTSSRNLNTTTTLPLPRPMPKR